MIPHRFLNQFNEQKFVMKLIVKTETSLQVFKFLSIKVRSAKEASLFITVRHFNTSWLFENCALIFSKH